MGYIKPDNIPEIGVDSGVYLEAIVSKFIMAVNIPLVVWPRD